jgi:predicted naringenin-chalcone synthase
MKEKQTRSFELSTFQPQVEVVGALSEWLDSNDSVSIYNIASKKRLMLKIETETGIFTLTLSTNLSDVVKAALHNEVQQEQILAELIDKGSVIQNDVGKFLTVPGEIVFGKVLEVSKAPSLENFEELIF